MGFTLRDPDPASGRITDFSELKFSRSCVITEMEYTVSIPGI